MAGANENRRLYLDFETFSSVDIGKCGSFKYMESPDFDILLLAYAFDDDPVTVVDLASGESMPPDFLGALSSPDVLKIAHNAAFEREALRQKVGYQPPEQWLDTMILAAQCGLPMSLDAVGKALLLPEDQAKMKEGKALIRYFCVPCKPTKVNGHRDRNLPEHAPEKWQVFKDYCGRDVETMRTVHRTLSRWAPSETEHRFWCLDAKINERGMRIDRKMVVNAIAMDARYKEELTAKAVALTGLDNPKSVSQIKNWLFDQEGQMFPSLNKKVIADVVSSLKSEDAKRFMRLRAELSKSSTAKYEAMLRSACANDHCKGCFQFYGANRTGRFAGRLVQLQNLPQNHIEPLDKIRSLVCEGHYTTLYSLYDSVSSVLSELIRTALIPEDGDRFLVSDFSAIEARVIAWIAGEQWRLDVFENGGDIYCASASQMFHVPVEKHGVNGELRQKGKIAELALGYGGGIGALKAFGADKMGMTEEEMQETVDLWRSASPKICALWKDLERAAIRCTVRGGTVVAERSGVRFDNEQGVLWMTLPSGRRIAYWGAEYKESALHPGRKALSYMGIDQNTKKWCRVETWGGKLTENCLAKGTLVLTMRGWVPIQNVSEHDMLWDGLQWCTHTGVICKGHQHVLDVNGMLCTPEHRIMTMEGWKDAKDCNGLDGLPVLPPDGNWGQYGEGFPRKVALACEVRMRGRQVNRHPGTPESGEAWSKDFMRMYEKALAQRKRHDTRHDEASGLRRLALHGSAMHQAVTSCVEKLRRSGNHGLRQMGTQLRELLGGHGGNILPWLGHRQNQQRARIQPGELPLGHPARELSEQKDHGSSRRQVRAGRRERNRNLDVHTVLPPAAWVPGKLTVRDTGRSTPVYDILDVGPNNRFTVLVNNEALLVHNCVQATARDCLREAMLALDAAGYDIRAHVHDEVIVSEPKDGRSVEEMSELMGRPIEWAPGLPLRADGYETPFYRKD